MMKVTHSMGELIFIYIGKIIDLSREIIYSFGKLFTYCQQFQQIFIHFDNCNYNSEHVLWYYST